MKVYFDHIEGFGKIKHYDFIFSDPYGILEEGELEDKVLREGWTPWGDKWYNTRSTRIDLSIYKPSKTTRKLSKKIVVQAGNVLAEKEAYIELYNKYCSYHSFSRDINFDLFKDCSVIEYHTDKLIGITLYKQFDTGFVAYEFIWDYEEPKLSLGTIAQMIECETAKLLNCEYVYLLGGYEKCCEYKSNYSGFEFWTGKEWSTDIELYKSLVVRDENINITGYGI
jgi:arginyl-tRNA--protein-N-Asp/Glu arginylyltransferase